jgi:methionyl-tRNA formyltransferase
MAPDLLIVVAYGQILKKRLLDIPRWGVLNIHASLLPKYRGAAPIQRVILNNETKTGLTAMRLDEGLDSGPILLQEETPIQANETAGELHDRLSAISAPFLIKTLEGLVENRLEERPQEDSQATYAAKIDPDMSLVQWDQQAEHLWSLIRALDPWPGAFSTLKGKKIKLFSSRLVDRDREGLTPGRIAGENSGALHVETGRGVLGIREVQLVGKKRLPVTDFLRGYPVPVGTRFGS